MNQFKKWILEMKQDVTIPSETDEKIEHTLKNLQKETNSDMNKKKSAGFLKSGGYRAVAAVCAVVLLAGSTAYATTGNFSLLSDFRNDSSEVKERAQSMLITDVKQTTGKDMEKEDASKVSYWVTSKVKEAVCDKNTVLVELEVKPRDTEKYLLKPLDADLANDLGLPEAFDTNLSVEDYARSVGKTSLPLSVDIIRANENASEEMLDHMSRDYQMQKDGSVIFKLQFNNYDKTELLKYRYGIVVTRPDVSGEKANIRDYFDFELEDQSKGTVVHYKPVDKNQIVKGTHLVVEDVEIEESDLSIGAKVTYRYTGETMPEDKWEDSVDGDVMFFYFDKDGNPLEDDGVYGGGEGGVLLKGRYGEKNSVYRDSTGLNKRELPDTLLLRARGIFLGKKWFGEILVKKAE